MFIPVFIKICSYLKAFLCIMECIKVFELAFNIYPIYIHYVICIALFKRINVLMQTSYHEQSHKLSWL